MPFYTLGGKNTHSALKGLKLALICASIPINYLIVSIFPFLYPVYNPSICVKIALFYPSFSLYFAKNIHLYKYINSAKRKYFCYDIFFWNYKIIILLVIYGFMSLFEISIQNIKIYSLEHICVWIYYLSIFYILLN